MRYDIIPQIDNVLRTRKTRASRMVAGVSMGGYGALLLALRDPDIFGAAASLSGALGSMSEMSIFMNDRMMGPLSGSHAEKYNLQLLVKQRINEKYYPSVYLNCGIEDQYLYAANLWFKKVLDYINYPYKFDAYPGGNDWGY